MEIKATQPVMPEKEAYFKEISTIWDNGIMTNNGEKVERFKGMLKDYLKCPHIDLFVNGHTSLLLAIKALNLSGEVITSPFTFASTTNAIVQSGLIPVFGDIDKTYNLNPDTIEKLITSKTSAIIAPHIFGIPCDVERIGKIAEKYGLKIIYDGAQAFGTKVYGKPISEYGDITMFSFHAIKVFNSIEGGALVYQDKALHQFFEMYRNFGLSYENSSTDVQLCGINAKMNEFQAAMGIVNLGQFEGELIKRRSIAKLYCQELQEIEGIRTFEYLEDVDYNYAYFPIKVYPEYGLSRDELWEELAKRGIGTRRLYDKLTCDYSFYKEKKYVKMTEFADRIKRITLDLPIYGSMGENEVLQVCEAIKEVRNAKRNYAG